MQDDSRPFMCAKSLASAMEIYAPLGGLLAIVAVFGTHGSVADGVMGASLLIWFLADYCGICIPLPPSKSRIRQWAESIATMFRKQRVAYAPASR